MKFALASDLHLEFAQKVLKNTENADLLILSGDICVADSLQLHKTDAASRSRRERFTDFFDQVSKEFPQIVYIMGNHEHYQGDFPRTAPIIREFLERNSYTNVHLLDKETVELKGFTIFGATLWSDFNRECPLSMQSAKQGMNDYHVVEDSRKPSPIGMYGGWDRETRKTRLLPEDTLREHKDTLISLRKVLEEGNPTIVVGHHSPSFRSVHENYKLEKYLNGAYHSNLEHIMEEYPNLLVWTHGHTHFEYDYKIAQTRVLCNPRGYEGYEGRATDFELKFYDTED